MNILLYLSLGSALLFAAGVSANKYSAELNVPTATKEKNLTALENPFRIQKINVLWEKAKKRLSDNKLKTLFADLKNQDKNELTLKKLKSEGQDKEGIKEASLRKQLKNIMNKYGLTDPWNDPEDNKTSRDDGKYELEQDVIEKVLFKDKKLNKLWLKAEKSSLSEDELSTLKEEFTHHQEKIEQYYQLLDKVNKPKDPEEDEEELLNSIDRIVEETAQKKIVKSQNEPVHRVLKNKHQEIKKGYDYLTRRVSTGKDDDLAAGEFEETVVQQLWEMAEKATFSRTELKSLKEELHHYEHRIKKLRHFQAELDLTENKLSSNNIKEQRRDEGNKEENYGQKHLQRKVKEIEYKVSKIHNELESRIISRHSEL